MKNGFSLIEILVVLMIISIFSSMIIIDYNKQKSNNDLNFTVKQVIEDIRIAQSNTINTLKLGGSVPAGGYGVKFSIASDASYILFADNNANKQYDSGSDGVVKIVTLPQGVVIDNVATIPGTAIGVADIIFTPPYGVIYINQKNASNFATVTLQLQLKKDGVSCPSSDCKIFGFSSEGKISK